MLESKQQTSVKYDWIPFLRRDIIGEQGYLLTNEGIKQKRRLCYLCNLNHPPPPSIYFVTTR